jgi:hypothetical protein
LRLAARPDYVALGPIYPTRLKVMSWAPQGLARLSVWRARIGSLPLAAIGGLNVERIAGAFEHAAASAAGVTDVILNASPKQERAMASGYRGLSVRGIDITSTYGVDRRICCRIVQHDGWLQGEARRPCPLVASAEARARE